MDNECRKSNQRQLRCVGFLAALLLCGSLVTRAGQQQQPPAASQAPAVQKQEAAPPAEAPEVLHLLVGRSLVISSPSRLRRVSIADPNIADAVIVNPNQILINGKAPGGVSLVLWDESGQSQTFEVLVELDVLDLAQKIRVAFPGEGVRVESSKDAVVVSGRASSPAVADKILEVVKVTTPKAISLMEVPAPPTTAEILLEVKFADVDRTALSQLGANFQFFPQPKTKFLGTTSTQQFSPLALSSFATTPQGVLSSAMFTVSDLLNVFLFRPDINVGATIKALEQKSLLQILAEPNVLTETGKEGSFLAGGEFPFPIIQPSGAGGVPLVTIQFKQFGVQLNFTPTLTADGLIHLKVRPEVSTLDFTNAVTIAGFLIPALSTRRVESEMDLRDGQSFAIAGLVDNRVTQVLEKIPGIGDIPVLGKLFQSRSLNKSKSELLVVVTPHVVQPSPPEKLAAGPRFPKPFLPPAAPEKPALRREK